MTDWLPEEFKREMEDMLGGEYGAYLESFGRPVSRGLRVNTLKWDRLECMEKLPCKTEPVPWITNGLFMRMKSVFPGTLTILRGCIISRSQAP